jgi:hypothetical protein
LLVVPPPGEALNKITVYEVRQNLNGVHGQQSFIITQTNKFDNRTAGGGSSQEKSRISKDGSGSSDEQGTSHPDFGETTTKREYEVQLDAISGGFRGLPEDLEN